MRLADSENQERERFFSRDLFAREVCAMFCNALSRPLHCYSTRAPACCIVANNALAIAPRTACRTSIARIPSHAHLIADFNLTRIA
jgi:hypothetical protein